ncbi:helix-turn-helix transcriptional regulator [Thalassomonas viridans]|uniref:Helix-turn-helix transcriptional regulator n=1 Tax=Thalassomonas viridans TaxID=137584 RepID=A0AAE9Z3W7_9GAMM|nr:helix-turn-helix domain-containing protein [Thalassomonas viridans]WDE06276.1 helix-turn-helix transcriptional regulator [Thalassomonas viridans]
MDKTLFNLHDLVLLLLAFECLAFSAFLMISKKVNPLGHILLAAFLVAHGLIALHELILWGSAFRHWVLSLSPNIFFSFNFAYFLDGPLLFLFCCSLVKPGFALQRKQLLHLLPAVIFLFYISSAYYAQTPAEKAEQITSYEFTYSWHYLLFDAMAKLSRIVYLLLALKLVSGALKATSATADRVQLPPEKTWIKYLLGAFFMVIAWEALLTLIKVYGLFSPVNVRIFEILGISDYYFLFALINMLIFLTFKDITLGSVQAAQTSDNHAASQFQAASEAGQKAEIKAKEPVNMDYVRSIEKAMTEDNIYRNPNISLERLAEQLSIPVKDLSSTINRHFQVNFYEYLNGYRINEARQTLEREAASKRSITDIFYEAGFNSKSVYNTLFKKQFNTTPSQYRKQFLAQKAEAKKPTEK